MVTCGDSHRRGRSLEYGPSFKAREKDDDLALFNEMQSRESDNFLLQPTDDFEDLLSKSGYLGVCYFGMKTAFLRVLMS